MQSRQTRQWRGGTAALMPRLDPWHRDASHDCGRLGTRHERAHASNASRRSLGRTNPALTSAIWWVFCSRDTWRPQPRKYGRTLTNTLLQMSEPACTQQTTQPPRTAQLLHTRRWHLFRLPSMAPRPGQVRHADPRSKALGTAGQRLARRGHDGTHAQPSTEARCTPHPGLISCRKSALGCPRWAL